VGSPPTAARCDSGMCTGGGGSLRQDAVSPVTIPISRSGTCAPLLSLDALAKSATATPTERTGSSITASSFRVAPQGQALHLPGQLNRQYLSHSSLLLDVGLLGFTRSSSAPRAASFASSFVEASARTGASSASLSAKRASCSFVARSNSWRSATIAVSCRTSVAEDGTSRGTSMLGVKPFSAEGCELIVASPMPDPDRDREVFLQAEWKQIRADLQVGLFQ